MRPNAVVAEPDQVGGPVAGQVGGEPEAVVNPPTVVVAEVRYGELRCGEALWSTLPCTDAELLPTARAERVVTSSSKRHRAVSLRRASRSSFGWFGAHFRE